MPALGQYSVEILSAYAISITLLAVLVLLPLWRARWLSREIKALEKTADRIK